ncbi:LysR family transcriptional regulator [Rosenbergiella collisarenosi]|uniref:LysR family transcriptional regulator n=1 Tax=Rosenbergiella collisarenosi TaxID=1544695 RepID=UPI001BDADFC3|nr:LysR family transcriptional regulator [Rosenbergiella collisarenosi]MBT0722699.1 LysR family transcriptional regulator [Rosenbergiella collisarenosi]
MAPLSWRQIEIFHAVMTQGTLTSAAALLRTSQPTLSRELARLEQQLTVPLFRRSQGRLHPTQQGFRLFEEVQRSWYGRQRIQETAAGLAQLDDAEITVACLPAFSQSLLPHACAPYLRDYPAASMTITPQESPLLEEWLTAQRFDLGITETQSVPEGCEIDTLLTVDEVCILAPHHPLATHAVLTPEDFRDLPFISLSRTDSYRQLLDQLFLTRGVARRLALETHSAASVCAMVGQGCGVSIINPLTALDYLPHNVVMRRFSVSVPFTVNLVTPRHRPASAARSAFSHYLRLASANLMERIDAALTQ